MIGWKNSSRVEKKWNVHNTSFPFILLGPPYPPPWLKQTVDLFYSSSSCSHAPYRWLASPLPGPRHIVVSSTDAAPMSHVAHVIVSLTDDVPLSHTARITSWSPRPVPLSRWLSPLFLTRAVVALVGLHHTTLKSDISRELGPRDWEEVRLCYLFCSSQHDLQSFFCEARVIGGVWLVLTRSTCEALPKTPLYIHLCVGEKLIVAIR